MIIGLGYRARSGKDTVAEYLVKNYNFARIAFADALKEECKNCSIGYSTLNPKYMMIDKKEIAIPDHMILWIMKNYSSKFDLGGGELRYVYSGMRKKDPILLQWWGTEFRRTTNPNYWTNIIKEKIRCMIASSPREVNIVISDMRFINEAKLIKDLGGEIWRVRRVKVMPEEPGIKTRWYEDVIATGRDPNHPSECELDGYKFDATLEAVSGDIKALYTATDKLLK